MDFTEIIIKSAMQNKTPVNSGDYIGDNGILYCGKCHTQKQFELKGVLVPCVCKCQAAEQKSEAERIKKEKKIRNLRRIAFPFSLMQDWTFENAEETKFIKGCKKWADNFDEIKTYPRNGLLLMGDVGRGKSYACACIVNALIDRGIRCTMTSFSDLVIDVQATYDKQDIFDNLNRSELLVLDDLGSERNTEYMYEIIKKVIDDRVILNKPLIVTTNLTGKQMKETTDIYLARIYSRIKKVCVPHIVTGEDMRLKGISEDFERLNKILEW